MLLEVCAPPVNSATSLVDCASTDFTSVFVCNLVPVTGAAVGVGVVSAAAGVEEVDCVVEALEAVLDADSVLLALLVALYTHVRKDRRKVT